ncbi:hypothetical protein NPIL_286821 [Nephila pilipes]|uniref:Uncharacterized protein n=1 Tax=Nephila pilipes TaxID=299642 RepID=A0A8X6QIR9_NEPPI|nr:hypothetical protein NPIL_286821 [Nephila pilipes]
MYVSKLTISLFENRYFKANVSLLHHIETISLCQAPAIQANDSPHKSHSRKKRICLVPDHPSGKGVRRDLQYTTTPSFTG